MAPAELIADTDALTLSLNGNAPVQVSEMAFVVLNMLQEGHDKRAILARGGPLIDKGFSDLENAGIHSDDLPEIVMPGHVFNHDDVPVGRRHIAGRLAERARRAPNALALMVEDPVAPTDAAIPVTVSELWEMADAVAGRLAGDGVGAGDHIALSAEPSLDTIVLCLAAWEVGTSVVLLRRNLPCSYLEMVQSCIAPQLWFMHGAKADRVKNRWIELNAGESIASFDTWVEESRSTSQRPEPDPDREAVVVTTSGSTGSPKMLALSHRNLYHTGRLALLADPDAPDIRHTSVTDLSALSGLRSLVVLPAISQTTSVILAPQSRENSLLVLASLGRHRVTMAQVIVGTLRAAVDLGADRLSELSIEPLKTICCGTGVLHWEICERAKSILNKEIRDHFGMNETTGAFAFSSNGTLGKNGALSQDLLLRIVDSDGSPCAPGGIGHLRLCGDQLFLGRYTESGFEARSPGWFTSGDMGQRLPDGRFIVTGRSHDLIKTHEGEFLSPIAVENTALAHPDLRDAVVLRLPDRDGFERYALFAEAERMSDGLELEISDHITGALGDFAKPELIITLPEIPRAAHQKPDRSKLKAILNKRMTSGGDK